MPARTGRKPRIAAPDGSKGCPRCEAIFPLIDPETGFSNFSGSYCRSCASARVADFQRRKAQREAATRPPTISAERRAEAVALAHITPWPDLKVPPRPKCSCCYSAPDTQVAGLPFCQRCGYYVAACGRCVDHSFREFVPSLLGRPDPPPLPYEATVKLPPYVGKTSGVRGRDEVDLEPTTPRP